MSNEEMLAKIRQIVNKAARTLTDEDKSFLLFAAEQANVQRSGKSGCVKCWHDLAVRCYEALTAEDVQQDDGRAYILKQGVDLIFCGIRINAATLTDELAEKIIARGFDTNYFAKCK